MDDESIMSEILDRPEGNVQDKAVQALRARNDYDARAQHDYIRFEERYGHYRDVTGGTDRQEALEVLKLFEQRQRERNEYINRTRAMVSFIQRNADSLGFAVV